MARTSGAVFVAVALALVLAAALAGAEATTSNNTAGHNKPYVLTYYVHIQIGGVNANNNFLPALNASYSAQFGAAVLFALNATEGVNATSRKLGFSRGYTVETSYAANVSRGVETVVIEYDDGTGARNGTFVIVGVVGASGTNEVAITGGTGTFRGARGYALISFAAARNNGTLYTFRHEAHFLSA